MDDLVQRLHEAACGTGDGDMADLLREAADALEASRERASITSERLAALCRAWLAVQDAPTVEVTQCNQIAGASDFDHGNMAAAVAGLTPGQRVRIVKEGE